MELYQNQLLTHNRQPYRFYPMTNYHSKTHLRNQRCGDQITLYLSYYQSLSATFQGDSCAVCRTSASIMMSCINNESLVTCQDYLEAFYQASFGSNLCDYDHLSWKAMIIKFWLSIRSYKSRHSCALLPWQTLEKAFENLL